MKRIKISDNLLSEVLGQVIISPSIIIHGRGGNVFAVGSDWNLEIRVEANFKRRQVLRLIRMFHRRHKLVKFENLSFWELKHEFIGKPIMMKINYK